jgi:hypothetical protein
MLGQGLYADLEIYVLSKQQRPDGTVVHRLELRLDHCQESGQHDALIAPIKRWDPTGVETREQYGERLFGALFADPDLKSAWDRMRGQRALRRIRLRVSPELPELHSLQWELLRDPSVKDGADLASSTATPFSRYLEQLSQPGEAVLERPIRVLVAGSDPVDLPPADAVAVQEEYGSLVQATKDLEDEDHKPIIQFDLLPGPCTLDAIRDALKQGYHVLHYVGHGVFGQLADKKGEVYPQAALVLEKPDRTMERVTEDRVSDMLAELQAGMTAKGSNALRLVFLASCNTARRDTADAYRGLAPRLVRAGIPAVVAMQDLVDVPTARAFAKTFYRQLLRHGLVDLACNEARAGVKAQALRGPDVPVVFTRLRSAELLRVRGHVTKAHRGTFWTRLLDNIDDDLCVPFLGPRTNAGILPRPETLARRLAQENQYPLADSTNLASVAQFEAYKDPGAFRRSYLRLLKESIYRSLGLEPTSDALKGLTKSSLTKLTAELKWAERSRAIEACRIYHQLAALELPLYVTTNADSFMTEALAARPNLQVRRISPRWDNNAADAKPPPLDPLPSNLTPYVLHLNGCDREDDSGETTQIAVSEDDYLGKFVRLARDQGQILPARVVTQLSQSSWVFLGYKLSDWEFRVVLQGLLQSIAQLNPVAKLHVGVQLDAGDSSADLDEESVQAYVQEYLGRRFQITVYWGSPAQFVAELHEHFEKRRSGAAQP